MWNTTGVPVRELGPAHPLPGADPERVPGIAYRWIKDSLSVLSRHARSDSDQGPRSSQGSMTSFQGRYEQGDGWPAVCLDLLAEFRFLLASERITEQPTLRFYRAVFGKSMSPT